MVAARTQQLGWFDRVVSPESLAPETEASHSAGVDGATGGAQSEGPRSIGRCTARWRRMLDVEIADQDNCSPPPKHANS